MGVLAALGLGPFVPFAHAGDAVTEAELVRRHLHAPVPLAERDAATARIDADRVGVSVFDAPAFEARHEAARGSAGATTSAIGASLTLDLGLSSVGYTRAAGLLGTAGAHRRRAEALVAACGIRAAGIDLWGANRAAQASEASQQRLDTLVAALGDLAAVGEASGYDRDRAALASMAHWTAVAEARGQTSALRTRVSMALGGADVSDVELAAMPPIPDVGASVTQLSEHPALRALETERRATAAARDAARAAQLPDLTLAGGGRWDAPPEGGPASPGFEVGGAIQIPWTDGSRAEAKRHSAEYAAADARVARARVQLEGEVRGAHQRLSALAPERASDVDPERVWDAAMARYTGGEASLDDLLQVAAAVEGARLATVERVRLQHRARLDLSCATGRFADPNIQSVFEEAVR